VTGQSLELAPLLAALSADLDDLDAATAVDLAPLMAETAVDLDLDDRRDEPPPT
jgi:hypothetical protein